jgi:hypothetical protein
MEESLKLNPQPEPPIRFCLTSPTSITMFFRNGNVVLILDKKSGKADYVNEMDPNLWKHLEVLEKAAATLTVIEGMNEYKEMRVPAAKMISSAVTSIEKIIKISHGL